MSTEPLRDLVQIARIANLEPLICHVYQSTSESIVASELSDSLDLDGLCLVPTKSIRYFDRDFERCDFYRAALGAWPSDQHQGLLGELSCNLSADLRLLSTKGEVVAVHMEIDEPDVCYVGTIKDVTDAALFLDRISSSGTQILEPLEIAIASITKLEVATRYLTAVGRAARILSAKQ